MPGGLAVTKAADRHAIGALDVGDHINLGKAIDKGLAVFIDGRRVEFAEATAEGDQVGIGQRLPANEEGRMLVPGALDDGKVGITDAREINTGHFGAHRRADLAH